MGIPINSSSTWKQIDQISNQFIGRRIHESSDVESLKAIFGNAVTLQTENHRQIDHY